MTKLNTKAQKLVCPRNLVLCVLLIHSADPQSRSVVITIFTHVVRPSVPIFQNRAKHNKFQLEIVSATGGNVGLAKWIIDDTQAFFSDYIQGTFQFTSVL